MVELFKQFVHTATAGSAWIRYESVEYKPKEGVRALYDDLMDAAERLVQPLSEIEISKRFMSKLPHELIRHLHLVRSITVETTRLQKILQICLEWEAAVQEYKLLQTKTAATSSGLTLTKMSNGVKAGDEKR
jgi:hypothetical protein